MDHKELSLNEQILEAMFGVARCLKESSIAHTEISHLTMQQLQALIFIAEAKKTSMKTLASYFAITMPTATTLIDKLVEAKLVERKVDATDRRVVLVTLSTSGVEILKKAKQARSRKAEEFLSYLNQEDKKDLLRLLTTLKERMIESERK